MKSSTPGLRSRACDSLRPDGIGYPQAGLPALQCAAPAGGPRRPRASRKHDGPVRFWGWRLCGFFWENSRIQAQGFVVVPGAMSARRELELSSIDRRPAQGLCPMNSDLNALDRQLNAMSKMQMNCIRFERQNLPQNVLRHFPRRSIGADQYPRTSWSSFFAFPLRLYASSVKV